MKVVQKLFESAYVFTVGMFFISAVMLLAFSVGEIWGALRPPQETPVQTRFVAVLECIALLTIAVASLELGQTILEEELLRSSSISAPTRLRRFLSRFIVVVVIALSIECLVAVFKFIHDSPQLLPHAATIGVAAATLLAAWGAFVRLNIAAEALEPESIKEATVEDEKVEASSGADDDDSPDSRKADPEKTEPSGASGEEPRRIAASDAAAVDKARRPVPAPAPGSKRGK